MIVADASWVIALLDPHDVHHDAATSIGEAAIDENILLHPVTLAECLVGAASLGVVDSAEQALRAAYEIAEFDDGGPGRWAEIRATSQLRLPDAIVLDAALRNQATGILTFDERLTKVARAHGIAVPD